MLCFSLHRSEEGKSLGWGSCTFDCRDAAERAVERFQGAWVDNRQIHLEVAAWRWKLINRLSRGFEASKAGCGAISRSSQS